MTTHRRYHWFSLCFSACALMAGAVFAQEASPPHAHAHHASAAAQAPSASDPPARQAAEQPVHAAVLAQGVVRKVDLSQGKITLRHGPIANLDMQPMTMVFRVPDGDLRALLGTLKVGDEVHFLAQQGPQGLAITRLQVADRPTSKGHEGHDGHVGHGGHER